MTVWTQDTEAEGTGGVTHKEPVRILVPSVALCMAAEWDVVIGQEAGHGGGKRKNLCLALEKFSTKTNGPTGIGFSYIQLRKR